MLDHGCMPMVELFAHFPGLFFSLGLRRGIIKQKESKKGSSGYLTASFAQEDALIPSPLKPKQSFRRVLFIASKHIT